MELMTVVCVVAILVGLASFFYSRSMARAKAVEGELAVREVDRLEAIYHALHQRYTDDLTTLGFAMIGGLKYYTVNVGVGSAHSPLNYVVVATPNADPTADGWVLRKYQDGTTTVDQVAPGELSGGSADDLADGALPASRAAPSTGPKSVFIPNSTGPPGTSENGGGAGGGAPGQGGGLATGPGRGGAAGAP